MKSEQITPKNQLQQEPTSERLRPILREAESSPKAPIPCGSSEIKEGESMPFRGIPSTSAGAGTVKSSATRASRAKLDAIARDLSDRDQAVLSALKKHRFLLSKQVQRFLFTESATERGNFVAANRALNRLDALGLVRCLKRRIGGVRAGSSGKVWHLTERGLRLLHLSDTEKPPRKPFEEPSPTFLRHTLSVAECAVQLHTLCRESEDMELIAVDSEPNCWRFFRDSGQAVQLKPDLFAVTKNDGFEDRWFIEIDLGTEAPTTVVKKCKVYRRYFYTGKEQEANEVFPLVVWVVKDDSRKERLRQYIREGLPPQPKMFIVITPDELKALIHQWLGKEVLC